MIAAGYRSPGRRAERSASCAAVDKRRAMAVPSMSIRNAPLVVQEDKKFYMLFLQSKKYEGKTDMRSKTLFNNAINKMRARWSELTEGRE